MTEQSPLLESYVVAAAQDDQLPAVYTYACEYVENGTRAVRGIVQGPKQIDALFHLPTDGCSLTDDAQVSMCMSSLYVCKVQHCLR